MKITTTYRSTLAEIDLGTRRAALLQPRLSQYQLGGIPARRRVFNSCTLQKGEASSQSGDCHCLSSPDCAHLGEGGSVQWCGTSPSGPDPTSNQGKRLREEVKPAQKCRPKHAGPSYFSTAITLERNSTASGLLLQQLWFDPTPIGGDANRQGRSLGSNWLWLQPLQLQPYLPPRQ